MQETALWTTEAQRDIGAEKFCRDAEFFEFIGDDCCGV